MQHEHLCVECMAAAVKAYMHAIICGLRFECARPGVVQDRGLEILVYLVA